MTELLTQLRLPALPEALGAATIDSHTHLGATAEYSGLGPKESLSLAASVGVTRVVDVGCDVASSEQAVSNAEEFPGVVAAVAIHPNDAARLVERQGELALDTALARIGELASHPRVRAIGETGLDYFRTKGEAGQLAQSRSFLTHIELAIRHNLTLVIHDRDAHTDVLRHLDRFGAPERVVMHCFSGDAEFALECVARDAWLSFPGVVTFGTAGQLREALAVTPVDKLLVETDAPYLTPKPQRGKPNAPYLLPHTVRFMATELGLGEAELAGMLARNAEAAFGGAWGENG